MRTRLSPPFSKFSDPEQFKPKRTRTAITLQAAKLIGDLAWQMQQRQLKNLFHAMSERHGEFGEHLIQWFNGGLFDDDLTLPLTHDDIRNLIEVGRLHRTLDAAVARAYGWDDYTPELPDEEILRRLLTLNLERAAAQ